MDEREKQIQSITRQLRAVYKSIQAHSKIVEKQCGLSSAQLGMLNEIHENPGLKVSHLAETLAIHTSTCSNMLDKLEIKELIHRDRRKTDQRSVHIYATEKGKALLAKAPQPLRGKLIYGLEQMEPSKLSLLEESLAELLSTLDVSDEKAGLTPIGG